MPYFFRFDKRTQINKVPLEQAHNGNWLPQALQARRENLIKSQLNLTKQLERLTEAYLAGVIPLAEYQRRRRDLESKQTILQQQVTELEQQVDRQKELCAIAISIEQFCQRLYTGLALISFEQKRQLIELLVDQVIVKNEHVEIHYVMPTSQRNEQVRFCHLRSDYQRTHSWHNKFRRLLIRWEKKVEHYLALIQLASAFIIYRLILYNLD